MMNVMNDTPTGQRKKRRRLNTVAVAPALMTLGNLLCGFAAIFYASRSDLLDGQPLRVLGHLHPLSMAAVLVFIGMVFDALDGRVARLTRQTSSFGAQLDSMADMVTFGVAPAFLVIQLVGIGAPFFASDKWDSYFDRAVLLIAGVYAACCALRLARFNVEVTDATEPSHMTFKGLPSPGAAGTVASLVLLYQTMLAQEKAATARWVGLVMVAITLAVALAMVSTLRYSHVMNRYFRGRGTFNYLAMLVIALVLLLTIPQWSIAGGFVVYALSAPVGRLWHRKSPEIEAEEAEAEPIDDEAEEGETRNSKAE